MELAFEQNDFNNLFINVILDKTEESYPQSKSETIFEDFPHQSIFSQTISNTSTEEFSSLNLSNQDCYLHKKLGRTPKVSKSIIFSQQETIRNNSFTQIKGQTHTKYFFDNILRKIKVLFHQFLIKFINECISIEFPNIKTFLIKKLDGKKTQDITLSHNKLLLNLTLKDTLIQFMSRKYKNFKPEENEQNINLLMNASKNLRKLFNMKYKECYSELFLNANEDFLGKQYGNVLNSIGTLSKFVNDNENDDHYYLSKLDDIARNKFLQHFLNSKLRKPKQKKLYL